MKTWAELGTHTLETILEWALNTRKRNFIPDTVNKGDTEGLSRQMSQSGGDF